MLRIIIFHTSYNLIPYAAYHRIICSVSSYPILLYTSVLHQVASSIDSIEGKTGAMRRRQKQTMVTLPLGLTSFLKVPKGSCRLDGLLVFLKIISLISTTLDISVSFSHMNPYILCLLNFSPIPSCEI